MHANPAPDQTSPQARASMGTGARLDAITRAKVDDLATRFHQSRTAVLSGIRPWSVSRNT
jgi:hypothetical protein